ncbi:RagB/SusD family nutrient uptake outer membrane protein [Hyunsoonleella sp. SJ7]|uniref:RagB/SusD family nutrient uptake outer membrane protein n=1 Tax=Hyunsoonleella aquatilis TaxID=2762758 RepID=A0A923KLW6_9FLAO|nr:RagB/SusD family nutrient uptake outer membrane protein [Hyunsoonleella aquatilis]MBC3758390.1 RagB/SusD family nutrient uptake outer membrane protein [Hyunsoonleella aquatilis]
MKLTTCLFLLLAVFLFGCSKDNEPPQAQTGNVQITVLIKENFDPIFDAIVSINSISREEITNSEGVAYFENIGVGDYEISIKLPFSQILIKQTIVVEQGQTTTETILYEGPAVVTPIDVDIDKLIEVVYLSLVYDDIFSANGYASLWGDIGADILTPNPQFNFRNTNLDKYEFNPGDVVINDIWENHYKVIRLTNIGIEAIENSEFTSQLNTDENIAKAHFKFVKALAYFNLVKLFGNPVLATSTDISEMNHTQDPLKVYEQIEEDLIFVANTLDDSNPKTKASKSAANALLGKVYLQMAGFPLLQSDKYAKALEQFAKLDGLFALEPAYKNNFLAENFGSNNEIIFAIDFILQEDPNMEAWDWFHWGPVGATERDFYFLTDDFVKSYFENPDDVMIPIAFPLNTSDIRFFENIASFTIQNGTSNNAQNSADWRPNKFSENYQNGESFYLPYLRYADVLLMIAEAENALNGPTTKAYSAINQVRGRAFGNSDEDLPLGLNQQQFLEAILEERRLELCYEGHRKDDLIRTQKLESVIEDFNTNNPQNTKNYQSHKYIFPIPQSEISLNPGVVQNPGY